jgi:hypothetical protein
VLGACGQHLTVITGKRSEMFAGKMQQTKLEQDVTSRIWLLCPAQGCLA